MPPFMILKALLPIARKLAAATKKNSHKGKKISAKEVAEIFASEAPALLQRL